MTPAIKQLQRHSIAFQMREYECTDDSAGYGLQAAQALGQNPEQVFKTLLAVIDGDTRKPVVAIIPVADLLDLKKLARHFNARKAIMADPSDAQRATGYVVGGISPIGQKQTLKSCIDESSRNFETVFVSGGKRGLQLEISPDDLIGLIDASTADVVKR